jgi:D-hydroxyproline dehydrogenase subunit beta
MQVQPMLAAATLLRGLPVQCGVEVRAISPGPVVETGNGDRIATGAVVNAAGVWGAEVAALAGTRLPVAPRRGFILVTEPLGSASAARRGVPPPIRHKVYSASYVSNVVSQAAELQTSVVVESTRAGTVLIGASRERVGFERSYRLDVLRALAAQAVTLFPFLAEVSVLRTYRGFRPYTPDHMPVIGPDPTLLGLYHACGHEGAGIGLAPATGALITAMLTGKTPPVDPHPYHPERFT